jgi:hypothetical protein
VTIFFWYRDRFMPRLLLSLLLLGLAVALVGAQGPPPAPQPSFPVIKVPVPSTAPPPHRALKYALLPDDLDLVQGNAAPQWLRAAQAASEAVRKMTPEQFSWASTDVALDKLPKDQVQRLLDSGRVALKLADLAARYDRCDWEYRPLTIQDLDLPLSEIQQLRSLANLLTLRCRLELAEGNFEQAARALQTGFALGRAVADAPVLVQNLVGVAITAIMLSRVEEWLSLPGAPDLYWPLTALPNPLVDCRRGLRNELGTLYRSFPQLRTLARETMTAEQASHLAGEILRTMAPITDNKPPPDWQGKLGLAALSGRIYPDAKKYLISRGRSPEQVAAMPTLQVVWIYYMDQYDDTRDDILKWINLPYWQARPGLEEVDRKVRAARTTDMNVFIGLLMPAILKVREACARTERTAAGLRCVAAIRRHAALHGGRLPSTLKEITEVPLPIDPATGKGFDEVYTVTDGKAVLEIPPLKGQPSLLGRRFEFIPQR